MRESPALKPSSCASTGRISCRAMSRSVRRTMIKRRCGQAGHLRTARSCPPCPPRTSTVWCAQRHVPIREPSGDRATASCVSGRGFVRHQPLAGILWSARDPAFGWILRRDGLRDKRLTWPFGGGVGDGLEDGGIPAVLHGPARSATFGGDDPRLTGGWSTRWPKSSWTRSQTSAERLFVRHIRASTAKCIGSTSIRGTPGVGPSSHYATWASLLSEPPAAVYEVGAGRGELLHALARLGYTCKGSEITSLRGDGGAQAHPRVTWGETDGVHLDRYEDAGAYDVVISNHVIEHLHPADLPEHLASAWRLLRPAGCYVLATPNRLWGPVGRVALLWATTVRGAPPEGVRVPRDDESPWRCGIRRRRRGAVSAQLDS